MEEQFPEGSAKELFSACEAAFKLLLRLRGRGVIGNAPEIEMLGRARAFAKRDKKIPTQGVSLHDQAAHELCYCESLPSGKCDFCSGLRDADWKAYRMAWLEYKDLYTELAKRANILEQRMGQIAMILRDDMQEKPIRNF